MGQHTRYSSAHGTHHKVRDASGSILHRERCPHRARTARAFLATLFSIFKFFSGWQVRGGLRGTHTTTEASTPASSPKVVVAAHTPCQGRAVGRGRRKCRTLRYGRSTEEPSAPQGAQACGAVLNVSRFDMLLNGVPIPMMQPFRFVLRFDCHDVGYQEASSSSSSMDVSDEPKDDESESESESESEPRRLVADGCP